MAEHALLSASGAHRWLKCTPSARLEGQFADKNSDYAAEGTLAHEVAELKVRKHFIEAMSRSKYNYRLRKYKQNELWDDEILRHTDTYLGYLKELAYRYKEKPYIATEKKVTFDNWVPNGFGTCDFILIGEGTLNMVDFKYGKGVPVSAIQNEQLKMYALGAYQEYNFLYDIKKVKLVVVQPRLDNISEFELSIEELLAWGEEVKVKAQRAYKGEGEFVPGDHCKFCRAKSLCRARSEFCLEIEPLKNMKPPLITNAEVGEILEKGKELVKWIKDLENYALNECINGGNIPGWKVVEGRSNRQFTDVTKAFEVLIDNKIDESMLYERKPITLASVEKLVGKKEFDELLKDYVVKPPGKPTLVPESDKRESLVLNSAKEDFKEGVKN